MSTEAHKNTRKVFNYSIYAEDELNDNSVCMIEWWEFKEVFNHEYSTYPGLPISQNDEQRIYRVVATSSHPVSLQAVTKLPMYNYKQTIATNKFYIVAFIHESDIDGILCHLRAMSNTKTKL